MRAIRTDSELKQKKKELQGGNGKEYIKGALRVSRIAGPRERGPARRKGRKGRCREKARAGEGVGRKKRMQQGQKGLDGNAVRNRITQTTGNKKQRG